MKSLKPFVIFALLSSSALAQPRLPFPIHGLGGGQPTTAEREFSAGDSLMQRGDLVGALVRFEAARRLDPLDARPVFYLGEVALRQARNTDAEGLFREAIRLRPAMAEAHAELGAALRELGRLPEAVTSAESALRLSPALGEAHMTLAMCLEDQGVTPRAQQEYRSAVRLLPDDPMPPLNLGLLLVATRPTLGSAARAEALSSLRSAVRRGATSPVVLASAGPALRQLGEARSAVDALERARALGPPTASLLGELSQALFAAGDRAGAEARISDAIRMSPGEPSLRYLHALMLASGAGGVRQATAEFREVLRLGPGTPLAERARQRIEALSAR